MVPDSYPSLPLTGETVPDDTPPNVPGGICSAQFLDSMPVYDRYIMVVKYFIDMGFYVSMDMHSIDPDPRVHDYPVSSPLPCLVISMECL
jgi:hypothetical protein